MKEREGRGGKLRGLGKSKESCKRKDNGKRKLTTNKQERERTEGERRKGEMQGGRDSRRKRERGWGDESTG